MAGGPPQGGLGTDEGGRAARNGQGFPPSFGPGPAVTSVKIPADVRNRTPGPRRRARSPRAGNRPLAFQSRDRLSILARTREAVHVRSVEGCERLRRSAEVRPVRGRVAARRTGAPMGPEGLRE